VHKDLTKRKDPVVYHIADWWTDMLTEPREEKKEENT
jgi:hypothetical protein